MRQILVITVENETSNPSKPFVKVFEKQVQIDTSISIPYNSFVETFRFVFGSGCVVGFKLYEYGKK